MNAQFIRTNDVGLARTIGAVPDCPRCNRRMHVKQMSPVLFASDFDDLLYGCVTCGAETKRTVRRR